MQGEGINDGCLGSRRNRRKAVESDGLEDWRGLGQDQGIVHLKSWFLFFSLLCRAGPWSRLSFLK